MICIHTPPHTTLAWYPYHTLCSNAVNICMYTRALCNTEGGVHIVFGPCFLQYCAGSWLVLGSCEEYKQTTIIYWDIGSGNRNTCIHHVHLLPRATSKLYFPQCIYDHLFIASLCLMWMFHYERCQFHYIQVFYSVQSKRRDEQRRLEMYVKIMYTWNIKLLSKSV